MNKIKTIDLWTEQHRDQFELFNGAFSDGWTNGKSIIYGESYVIKDNEIKQICKDNECIEIFNI